MLDRKKPEDKQRNFGEIVIDDLNRIKGVNKEILTLLLSPEKYAQQFKRLHASNETFYELLNGIGTKEQNGIVLGNAKREILAIIQKCVIDNSEAIKKRLDNIPIAGSEKSNNVINALEIRTTKNHEQLLAIYVRIESRFKFLANLMEVLIANNDTGKTLRVPKKADETLFDFMNNKDINEKHFKSLHESNKANYVMLESLEKILKEYSPSGEMPHTTSQKIVDETSKQTAEYVATFLNNFQAELNKQIIHSFNVNHEKIVKSVKDVGEDNKVDANLILDYLKTNSKEIKSIKETLSNTDFATTGSVEKIFKLIACENEKRAKERNTFTELIDELMKEVRAIEKRHSFGLIRRFWNWIW